MIRIIVYIVASFLLSLSISTVVRSQGNYTVGVFYFPGFADDHIHPWSEIESYEETTPDDSLLINYEYNSSKQETIDNELLYMSNYGVSVVVFDWYWTKKYFDVYKKHLHEDALNNYMVSNNSYKVKFALMWDNYTTPLKSMDELDSLIDYLAVKYLSDSRYFRVNGKPVIYIFDAISLDNTAKNFGYSLSYMLNYAKNKFKSVYGLDPLFYAGGIGSVENISLSKDASIDGFFQYNYHSPITYSLKNGSPYNQTHSYLELMAAYSDWWNWFKLKSSDMTYIPPVSSGWNKKPWGGSKDAFHDGSSSTPDGFELHLKSVKSFIDENEKLTSNQVLICCWNEFGEGAYIAPTKQNGFKYLEKIKTVFSNNPEGDVNNNTKSGTETPTPGGNTTTAGNTASTGDTSVSDGTASGTETPAPGGNTTTAGNTASTGDTSASDRTASGSETLTAGSSSTGSSPSVLDNEPAVNSTNQLLSSYRFSASGLTSDGSDVNTLIAGEDGNQTDEVQVIDNTNMSMIENGSSFKVILRFQKISDVLIQSAETGKILVATAKNAGDEIAVNSTESIKVDLSDLNSTVIYYNGELLTGATLTSKINSSGEIVFH